MLFTGLLLVAACSPATVTANGGAGPEATPVPFEDFLQAVNAANYRDFADQPGTAVPDQAEFARMRAFLLERYRDVRVVSSYVAGDAVFDCVRQPQTHVKPPAAGRAPSAVPAQTGTPTSATCPEGAVPVRRVTLEDLVRFSRLEKYLGKSPDGGRRLPPETPFH